MSRESTGWASISIYKGYAAQNLTSPGLAIQREAKSLLAGLEFEVDSHSVLELVRASDCSAYDCEFIALAKKLNSHRCPSVIAPYSERKIQTKKKPGKPGSSSAREIISQPSGTHRLRAQHGGLRRSPIPPATDRGGNRPQRIHRARWC